MSNSTETREQKLAALLGAGYDKETIPGRLMAAEDALLQCNARLAEADAATARAVKEATDKAMAEVSRRTEERAIEIMAGVGSPKPSKASPNSGASDADEQGARIHGVAAVEEMYRQKYGIT